MIRYFFRGTIHFLTAFHVGAPGGIKQGVDNPVLTDVYGNPVIPGSSLKGLIRSCAERSAEILGLKACGLFYKTEDKTGCATTGTEGEKKALREKLREKESGKKINENDTTEDVLSFLKGKLCDTCWLFGSSFHASRVRFPDPSLISESWTNTLDRRDGVGIDRDSGLAVNGVKYDFETVPAGVRYAFKAEGEDLDEKDLALLGAALLEMTNGSLSLGGKKSRGLGRFRLEDLEAAMLDLNITEDFLHFLAGDKEKFHWIKASEFFEPYIKIRLEVRSGI
jgi:CRISPR-associated RAMP protein (TIGR02581 family)